MTDDSDGAWRMAFSTRLARARRKIRSASSDSSGLSRSSNSRAMRCSAKTANAGGRGRPLSTQRVDRRARGRTSEARGGSPSACRSGLSVSGTSRASATRHAPAGGPTGVAPSSVDASRMTSYGLSSRRQAASTRVTGPGPKRRHRRLALQRRHAQGHGKAGADRLGHDGLTRQAEERPRGALHARREQAAPGAPDAGRLAPRRVVVHHRRIHLSPGVRRGAARRVADDEVDERGNLQGRRSIHGDGEADHHRRGHLAEGRANDPRRSDEDPAAAPRTGGRAERDLRDQRGRPHGLGRDGGQDLRRPEVQREQGEDPAAGGKVPHPRRRPPERAPDRDVAVPGCRPEGNRSGDRAGRRDPVRRPDETLVPGGAAEEGQRLVRRDHLQERPVRYVQRGAGPGAGRSYAARGIQHDRALAARRDHHAAERRAARDGVRRGRGGPPRHTPRPDEDHAL